MEDILKILVTVGILIFGFLKHIRKDSSSQSEPWEGDLPEPDEMPVLQEEPMAAPVCPPQEATPSAAPLQAVPKPKRKKPQAYQPVKEPPTTPPEPDTSAQPENDYTLRSAEEARKAIIWGEILERKY